MYELFFSEDSLWFTIPAFVGTAVFLLRLAMMFMGDLGLDLHHDISLDGNADLSHSDPSEAFKILSIQSIAAFLMGFGWGALGGLRGTGLSPMVSALIGVGCGVAMMWFLAISLKAIHDMQTSGNIAAESAIGNEATVYVGIPAEGEGQGQVQVVIDERQRTYNAVSTGPSLPTHSRVRVIGIMDGNTLTVAPIA